MRAAFALLLLVLPASSFAYVRTMAEAGMPLFWASPFLSFYGNPTNQSGMSEADVQTEISAAFSSWMVSGTTANAHYSQSTGAPADSNMNGVNSVYFAPAGGRQLDYGVVALTEVTYYLSSGQIVEADMVFNDRQFKFTTHPGDTGTTIA